LSDTTPTDPRRGLTHAQAAARIRYEGHNELPSAKPRSVWAIAADVVREPMFLLLLAAAGIYFILGDRREALVLGASVFVILAITFYQERKTERALEALRDLSSPRALVIREGETHRIAGREVVRGDILVLKEGDRVPADAALVSCTDFKTDESLLTGESVPVRKIAGHATTAPVSPGGDDLPFVYSGTLAVQGQGIGQVTATGLHSEIGKIGKALAGVRQEPSRIQQETRRTVLIFAAIGLTSCALVVLLYGMTRGDWLQALLAGITLAMANLPEEFPVVLTVFLALGAWRISRRGVLTRHGSAVETLGSITVLCVDKTGTLTQNRMAVRTLCVNDERFDVNPQSHTPLPERYRELVELSILASEVEPFDPMEKAFLTLGERHLAPEQRTHRGWIIAHEYPLSPQLLAHSHLWRRAGEGAYLLATKGAPEAVADLCHFDSHQRARLEARVNELAVEGLRVLGVARAELAADRARGQAWPPSQHDFTFTFLGLVGLADPIRPAVPGAIKQCYRAGIRTVMITGDYPGTAQAIAREIGLHASDKVITGQELAAMSDADLAARALEASVFARMVPEQKLRLVNALKAAGEVVAMTGDGVNDAPALKAAHIGIAMGERGTDVAREAAALVLLDDDFASIVRAVRLGRRIFENIRKAMSYIVAVHVPTAGMALAPLLFGWPLVLFPVHVVFLEFVIDPACSIVFEAEPAERDLMRRPPRRPTEHLLNRQVMLGAALQGVGIFVAVFALYGLMLHYGAEEARARAMAFTTIVLGNLGLILANRSARESMLRSLKRANPALWWVVGGTLAALAATLWVPPLRELFRFGALSALDVLLCAVAAIAGVTSFEIYKAIGKGRGP
jgi:P-type Ca2+ transporter type 2C